LVKLGKPGEIARDARQGRRPALIQNGPILSDNRLPIFGQYGDGEGFLAVEVIIERTLGHAGCRGDLLHARGVEAAGAHKVSPFFQEARSRFRIGWSRHELIYDRSSYYRQAVFLVWAQVRQVELRFQPLKLPDRRGMPLTPSHCVDRRALGRSRGGFTSKLHCLADALGRPLALILTGGEAADCKAYDALVGLPER